MKAFVLALVAAFALTPVAAVAQDFEGPRIEVTASAADVSNVRDTSDIDYGIAVGFDKTFGDVLVGVEASSDNAFDDDRTIGAAARLGYVASDSVLLYTKAGYENYRYFGTDLDGLRVGAGVEVNVSSNAYVKAEARYADFESNVSTVGGQVGFGLRF
jgi:outer membrane immunogenic protein